MSTFSIWLGVTFPEIKPELLLDTVAVVITVGGTLAAIRPREEGAKNFTLRELQSHVGGCIEILPFKHGVLVCDEDGKSKGYRVNEVATKIFRSALRPGDKLVGNVMICKTEMVA